MKRIFAIAFISLISFSAAAYKDGTYNCKNRSAKLPDNVYKIQTLNVGGVSIPHVEVTLYFFSVPRDENSTIVDAHLKGLATVSSSAKDTETLQVAALNLSFEGDTFTNCRK